MPLYRHSHRRHLPTRFSTALAALGTLLHHRVIAKAGAVISAALANLGTDATGTCMKRRAAQHKIGAGLANLDAVQQEPNVAGFGMTPALG